MRWISQGLYDVADHAGWEICAKMGSIVCYYHSVKRRSFLHTTLAAVAFIMSGASLALRGAVADILHQVKPRQRPMLLPPLPQWNKLTDDIDAADFVRRSRDFERSLLPRGVAFPRTGQIWETVRDCEVWTMNLVNPKGLYLPMQVRLRQGTRVRILPLEDLQPLQIKFQLIRDQKAHVTIAPDQLAYELMAQTARTIPIAKDETFYFTEIFKLVEELA